MRRFLVAAGVGLLAFTCAVQPAAAHTSLVVSVPGDGEIVERAPERLELTFATKVESRSLRLEMRRADGGGARPLALAQPDGPSSFEHAAELPDLEPGPYVVSWVSVGPDGHRASGEVVFGVGAVALADLRTASAAGGGLDMWQLAGGIARWGLVAALALATGGVLASRWSCRHRGTPLVEVVAGRAGPAMHVGLLLCGALLAVRAGIVAWTRVDLGAGALTGPVTAAFVVAVVLAVGTIVLRRLRRRAATADLLDAASVAALAAVALASAGLGHAGASEAGVPVLLAAGIHGLTAAAWLGPLLMAGLVIRDAAWRAALPGERSQTARRAGRSVAPVAAASFVALASTGVALALVQGSWSEFSRTFQWTLGAKAALVVAVVLPLGALHDRCIGWTSRRSAAGPSRSEGSLGRTLAAEAVALAMVVAAGSTLATADPLAPAAGSTALAAVEDPASCAELPAGRMSCYRRYLTGVLDEQGADEAAAELDRLAATVPEVGTECHQLAHDLGNDAVAAFDGVAAALAEAPPTCWSGYFHGVVELAVARVGTDPSGRELHKVCESLFADDAYGLPHYNCVHGLGHGVMLIADHALMPALELCDRVEDSWEQSSCYGGVFMERVISIQASPERDDSNGDLLYPCSKVKEDQLDECFLMQSSYFLWKLNYDFAAGFGLCDQAPEVAVDICYRSMGRDIASLSRHEPGLVAERCGLGAATRFASCVEAAALDAALDAVNADAAGPLCAVLPAPDDEACVAVAASTVGVDPAPK